MYVLLERPGQPLQRIKIEGDRALVGRASHCDVVIEEEFVSKQHLLLLHGVIAIDQSTNGTFVDGNRIASPFVLGARPANLAQSDITIRVEVDAPVTAPATGSPDAELLRADLERLRGQVQELERAKAAVEAQAQGGEALRQQNEALRATVRDLEQRLREASLPPLPEKPADDSPVSVLIFKLKMENAELKRALAQPPAASPAPPAAPASVAAPASTPASAQKPATVGPLKPSVMAAFPAMAKMQKPSGPDTVGVGDKSANAEAERAASVALARLAELVKLDADELQTRANDPLDAFLMTEGFRFLRRVERVVSRVASGLIQLYHAQTLVPGVEGTLRDCLRSALAHPDRAAVREGFLGYLREMGRWMVAALLSYRQAAEKFVVQLRNELSPEALAADDPALLGKKLTPKAEAELWRRATTYLRDLNSDRIRERLEKLARDAAEEVVGKDGVQAFG